MVLLYVISTGCITNQNADASIQQTSSLNPLVNQTQKIQPNESGNVTHITRTPTITTGAMLTKSPNITETLDPQVTSTLTEEQAWNYAAVFLRTVGIQNIQPNDIESHGFHKAMYENGTQTMVWEFEVYHSFQNGNVTNLSPEGDILIDAYNGDVVFFAPYD